eukprot:c33487_g1_i1 orf=205-1227(-)
MGIFNVMELKLKHSRWVLRSHGLEARMVELENGSSIHCWVPSEWSCAQLDNVCSRNGDLGVDEVCSSYGEPGHPQSQGLNDVAAKLKLKPALLLLHGFGADGTIGWERQVPSLAKHFSLFLPDLLFFGESRTHNKQRTELFQAECMFTLMEKLGIVKEGGFAVCGHSYGGFVAYRMAHLYPRYVKRVVIMSSGILMDSTSNNLPLLQKFGASKIEDFLIPHTALDFQKGLTFIFHRVPWMPSFVFKDMFELLSGDQQGRHELIDGLVLGKKNAPSLPKISQGVLIIWGDHDQVFNVDLAYALKDFLGDNARLIQIKEVGHMPHMEKPKEVNLAILKFLTS